MSKQSEIAYVRSEMLDQKAPPVSERGVIKWLRENLFSGPMNTILTLLSLWVIYTVMTHLGPWLQNSIWKAGSLSECRDVRDATWGADATMSCFAVITDRWDQLLFGYYPADAYWRPTLALLVLFAALAPILFSGLPRKMLILSAVSPFIMYWLIWGGSIWGPLALMAALGWSALAFPLIVRLTSSDNLALFGSVAIGVLSVMYAVLPLAYGMHAIMPIGLEYVPSKELGGFMLSVIIGVSGIVLSLPLGILLALGRQSKMLLIYTLSVAFIEIIRGVPLIVWLFTAHLLLNYFLPPGTEFDLLLRVIIMVTLFSSAYIAEVIRGGLAALPKGQYEAADALGLDYAKSMRLIVLPQALKISIPGIVNTFIGLFKDTSLVMFIGLVDPFGLAKNIRADMSWAGIYWEIFVFIGLMYFIFCFAMGRYSNYLEQKLHREHR